MVWIADERKRHWDDVRELMISHGRVDFRCGRRISQNPYATASANATNWEIGWKEAFSEKQVENKGATAAISSRNSCTL